MIEYTRDTGDERMLTGGVDGFSVGVWGVECPGEEGSEAIVLWKVKGNPGELRLSRDEDSRSFDERVIVGLSALMP